jgi:hypothetical protein
LLLSVQRNVLYGEALTVERVPDLLIEFIIILIAMANEDAEPTLLTPGFPKL